MKGAIILLIIFLFLFSISQAVSVPFIPGDDIWGMNTYGIYNFTMVNATNGSFNMLWVAGSAFSGDTNCSSDGSCPLIIYISDMSGYNNSWNYTTDTNTHLNQSSVWNYMNVSNYFSFLDPYVAITNLVSLVGNWTADKSAYWNTSNDLDTVISSDEIAEGKIAFSTECAAGNHYYLNGNDLACEADDDTTYSSGAGLGLVNSVFSHNDSSSQDSSDNSGRTYIQDILLDTYGHITSLVTATETVVNTDTNASTACNTNEYLDGDGNCVDVITEAELSDISELNTQITDATFYTVCGANQARVGNGCTDVLTETELNSLAELDTQIGISGSAGATTYWRGDNSWTVPPNTQLSETTVEAYIFDTDNTANLGMGGYDITNVDDITFTTDPTNHKIYDNATCLCMTGDTAEICVC